jgi:hypothetical protein
LSLLTLPRGGHCSGFNTVEVVGFMKAINFREIKIQHLWAITVVIGIFVFVNTAPIRPHDFWWHIAVGREIVSTGNIPSVDEYSFTMQGQPYPSYQMFWLADVTLYNLYEFGGPALIVFIQSLIITAAYGLLLWLCWRISSSFRIAALATIFAVALGIDNWNVRPQTISYLIGVVYLLAIYFYRKRPHTGWLVVFPIGMLLWVNSHGSFVIGLVLIGIWLGDEIWRRVAAKYRGEEIPSLKSFWAALAALSVTLIACLINPRTLGIVRYVQTLSSSGVVQDLVPEWAAPTFDDLYGTIFLIALLLSSAVLSISPKRPGTMQLLTFLVFGGLGLYTTRGVIWFGIVMAPVLADHIAAIVKSVGQNEVRKPPRAGFGLMNLAILILLLCSAIISLPWFNHLLPLPQKKAGLISSETPLEATEILLKEQPPGQLFHEMGFGSYLIWTAGGDYKVFIDPRIELYPLELWRDYLSLSSGRSGWEDKLQGYEINTLMLNPATQRGLIEAAGNSPEWSLLYENQAAVLYVKKKR